ncbi:hypothetical protein LOTGIDRAFT_52425, partial [Lottia gigantea]
YDLEDYEEYLNNHITPSWAEWIFVVIYFLTFIMGLVGNSLVVFAVWKNHSMRTVTNVFIVNLAIGDFLVISLCLPPTLVQDITFTWFLGLTMCKLLLFLQNLSVSVSVLTLSAISIERWYAICHPLRFKSTLSRARNMIIIIWIVSAGAALPELVVAQTYPYVYKPPFTSFLLTSCRPSWDPWVQSIYQTALMIVMYLFPLTLMALTYANIAYVLWRKEIPGEIRKYELSFLLTSASLLFSPNRAIRKPSITLSMIKNKLQSRRRAAKMLITIVVVFALCYLPVHLLNMLRYFGVLVDLDEEKATLQSLASHWLPYLNSSINPVIYNFMSGRW